MSGQGSLGATVPKRVRFALLAILATLGCSGGDGSGEAARDSLTQRQQDSLVGELPIPGARGVHRAMDAADSARTRQRMLDTIGG